MYPKTSSKTGIPVFKVSLEATTVTKWIKTHVFGLRSLKGEAEGGVWKTKSGLEADSVKNY